MAAEVERQLLNHYKIDSLYPSEWPQRDDEDDNLPNTTGDHNLPNTTPDHNPPNTASSEDSRFAAAGPNTLVQKDEPDPLGIAPSVVQQLRRRGLPVEDNLRLRNRFMLSSTTFSPNLFLSQVHQDASTDSLLRGLDFLSQSIEKKSASLKLLVESNFERFVKAKATIDNVYQEMRNQGQDNTPLSPIAQNHRRQHSRQTSKVNAHFRSTSGSMNPTKSTPANLRKNALTKETEYGVLGIKAPLIELAVKAEEVWGPALGGRDKEEELKNVLSYVEHNRTLFTIAGNMHDAIKKRDYDILIQEYNHAKRNADQATQLADAAQQQSLQLTDSQVHQIVVAAKIWHDTQNQLKSFKRDAWSQLANTHTQRASQSAEPTTDSHMTLIAVLLQLGVDENPICFYLNNRAKQLNASLTESFERLRIELEVARRKLANEVEPPLHISKVHLQSPSLHLAHDRRKSMDTPKVLDFWEKVQSALTSLLAVQGGILGEILDFWETARSFISGNAQRDLPNAVFSSDTARRHLQLEDDEIARLRQSAAELITTLRDTIFSFFADPPIQDISSLFSPVPDTPTTPQTPANETRNFSFDINNIPEPSNKGATWEKYAFWPPYSNSLSGAYFLGRILLLAGSAATEAGSLSLVQEDPKLLENLKTLVVSVRERCVQAVCAAWNADSDTCKLLEDWTRSPDRRDLTTMPFHFMNFEEAILQNVQKILFLPDIAQRSASASIIVPPSGKLLQVVRHQFVSSMYKALSGTVENAERNKLPGTTGTEDPDGLTTPAATMAKMGSQVSSIDITDKNVRTLLSLSNLSHLRKLTIPHLLSTFETSFSVSLTDEQKTLRDVLGQIDSRLFQSYTAPTSATLSSLVASGIASPSWEPPRTGPRPSNARPYIYDVLLALVLVHSEVSSTASTLVSTLLSHHLETISSTFLSSFRARKSYTLPALMQATLDVELVAQTLANFTTERASELQSQIYLVLDERTDAEARSRLQGELPEMRAVLKRLREGTKGEFGCFKRERRGRGESKSGSRGVNGGNGGGGNGNGNGGGHGNGSGSVG